MLMMISKSFQTFPFQVLLHLIDLKNQSENLAKREAIITNMLTMRKLVKMKPWIYSLNNKNKSKELPLNNKFSENSMLKTKYLCLNVRYLTSILNTGGFRLIHTKTRQVLNLNK
jgi:hypothetical protein